MSATMLDRTFPTTVGFCVASGFDLPASKQPTSSPGFAAASGAVRTAPLPALNVKVPVASPLQPSYLQKQSMPVDTSVPSKSQEVSTPTNSNNLGWKGLLEISRNSGASGVLGFCKNGDDAYSKDAHIEICCTAHTSTAVRRLVKSVVRGLKACQEPEATKEGMGGTYFFTNENGRKVAIIKPCDEEPLAPNNPKGYVGRSLGDPGWKPTVRVGEAAMREVAAYLLDHDDFAKVPTSVLVRARHPVFCYNSRMSSVRAPSSGGHTDSAPGEGSSNGGDGIAVVMEEEPGVLPMKLGSLQEFVLHDCDTSEMGPSRFSARDIHRIGILDIRLFNTDRHAGNMLVRKPAMRGGDSAAQLGLGAQYELIPIDHGFCLPETLEAPYFEWLHWPQTMLPFSDDELAYIARLDVQADKELLQKELPNLRPECLRVMELSTTLLKQCAEAGLTLFEIASILSRPYEAGDEEPSDLEKLATSAKASVEAMSAEELEDDGTIEEESEYDEDEDGEEDDEGDDCEEDYDIGMECVAVQPGRACVPAANGGSSSREDESMLFYLDDENAAVHKKISSVLSDAVMDVCVPTSNLLLPVSPGNSSLESSLDNLSSFGTPPIRAPAIAAHRASVRAPFTDGVPCHRLGATVVPMSPIAGAPTTPMGGIASSVHVTDGFLWRRMKTRQSSQVKRTHGHKRPGALKLKHSPQAYPPPVGAFSPEALNGLFSDMDGKQWARFMEVVEAGIAANLRSGKWRQGPKDTGVAMSCPRF